MTLISNYQKGWALRYLREAKAELTAAQKSPYIAPGLIIEALRKAQSAIYYSLGDAPSVEAIVMQTLLENRLVEDHLLRFLVEIEKTVQNIARTVDIDRERSLDQANDIIQIASEVAELFACKKAD